MEKFVVIMAGGVGSRFWPRSRKTSPKQLLSIFSENSMIRETFLRVNRFIRAENVFVITNELQAGLIGEQLKEIPPENIIAEPVGKNTAPCVAVAARVIANRSKDSVLITLPADHLIKNETEFERLVITGCEFANESKGLVTFGITPTRPETGYGYINIDRSSKKGEVFRVNKFVEKPDAVTAKEYLESGDYLWNSGMFIWRSDVILEEIKQNLPEVFKLTEEINSNENLKEILTKIYPQFESISVDYGVMERSENVYVIEGDFGWSDVGSWESVYELSEKDNRGNTISGDVFTENTKDSYIFSESKFTAVIGFHDAIIINLKDSTLVCKRDQAQSVKKVVEYLEQLQRDDLV